MKTSTENQLTNFAFECRFCGCRSNLRLRECPECGRLVPLPGSLKTQGGKSGEVQVRISTSPFRSEKELDAPENYVYRCAHCQYQTPRKLHECPECGRARFERTAGSPGGVEQKISEPIGNKNEKRNWVETIGFMCLYLAFEVFILGYGIGFENGAVVPRDYEIGECWLASFCLIIAGIPLYAYGKHLEKRYKPRFR